jgi:hypothetical protein
MNTVEIEILTKAIILIAHLHKIISRVLREEIVILKNVRKIRNITL